MVFWSADVRSPEVRFNHWRFRIAVPEAINLRRERIRRAMVAWYRAMVGVRLRTFVEKWLTRFGGSNEPLMLIRNQHQIWGSSGPDGTLSFNCLL